MSHNPHDPPHHPHTEHPHRKKMKIEAVITCVNYADFLAHTLPLNRPHFDRVIVVTAPEDAATKRVCDAWRQKYHATDAFNSRWGEFKKGAGINEGLAKLDKDAWIVHMDADIILPPHFRESLEGAELDTSMIYGCDRVECQSWEEWQRFFGSPEPAIGGNGVFIHTTHSPFRFGTRVQFPDAGGWVPIGFFQLWHADSKRLTYPQGHTNAGREDSQFPKQWPRSKRGFLPEIIAYHLESENAPMAVNWSGRKTKSFSIDGETRR